MIVLILKGAFLAWIIFKSLQSNLLMTVKVLNVVFDCGINALCKFWYHHTLVAHSFTSLVHHHFPHRSLCPVLAALLILVWLCDQSCLTWHVHLLTFLHLWDLFKCWLTLVLKAHNILEHWWWTLRLRLLFRGVLILYVSTFLQYILCQCISISWHPVRRQALVLNQNMVVWWRVFIIVDWSISGFTLWGSFDFRIVLGRIHRLWFQIHWDVMVEFLSVEGESLVWIVIRMHFVIYIWKII